MQEKRRRANNAVNRALSLAAAHTTPSEKQMVAALALLSDLSKPITLSRTVIPGGKDSRPMQRLEDSEITEIRDECAIRVTRGASWYSIAEAFGVDPKYLQAANRRLFHDSHGGDSYPPIGVWVRVPDPTKGLSRCAVAPKGSFRYDKEEASPDEVQSSEEVRGSRNIGSIVDSMTGTGFVIETSGKTGSAATGSAATGSAATGSAATDSAATGSAATATMSI